MDWDLHLPDRPVTIGHRVQTFGLPEAAACIPAVSEYCGKAPNFMNKTCVSRF